ncbi:MAG: capsular biosynthesis protein [Pseudomonadales bacterium]|jgi:capsule biosynthesis phosphatase|nr:capsular biosynthesis protein [Pseudomonadales bacterium]
MLGDRQIVCDLDSTLCFTQNGNYPEASPNEEAIRVLREYKRQGFEIVIHTSRNMRTYAGDVGKIAVHTLPGIITWLNKHEVPYDAVHIGKPWCGREGFYVDDKAIRPDELVSLSYQEIRKLIGGGE